MVVYLVGVFVSSFVCLICLCVLLYCVLSVVCVSRVSVGRVSVLGRLSVFPVSLWVFVL